MAEVVDTDAVNEIIFDASIGKFDEWAVTNTRTEVGVEELSAPDFTEGFNGLGVSCFAIGVRRTNGGDLFLFVTNGV